jgi:tetratricopeptide (TPR) repeat protein
MLDDLILPEQLESLAGAAAFKRGEAYFREGRATIVIDEPDRVAGAVSGSGREPYYGQIQVRNDRLGWICSCPVGDQGDFCKHLVALALTRLAAGDEVPLPNPPRDGEGARKGKRRTKEDEIRAFLEGQDKDRLVEWLLEVARWDRATREKLLLAARAGGSSAELKRLVTDVTRVRDFLGYHDMPDFARRVHEMIDALAHLRGSELRGLAEYGVERLHKVLEACDDSDGYMSELLGRLAQLHTRACAEARPEPAAFARWLFERQMQDDWDTWPGVEAYWETLGENGMAEYTRLARAAWDALPTLKAGNHDRDRWGSRFRIKGIMERLAKLSGDPEALVEIERKDLSSPYAYLCIAEIYQKAGRHDAALDWAERGLADFPRDPDWRIQDFLVDEYFRRGRQDDAMAIAWTQFGRHGGSAEGYKTFMSRAQRTAAAEAWRARALGALREAAANQHEHYRPLYGRRPDKPDHTQLVKALLWDKDLDAALAEAQAGICHAWTLVDLAQALAPGRPEAAVALYKRAVHPIADLKKNDAYAEAAGLVRAVRDLLEGLGREGEFGDWLAEVRLAHKPKRNFIKLLDTL